jgi:hypothetical protein
MKPMRKVCAIWLRVVDLFGERFLECHGFAEGPLQFLLDLLYGLLDVAQLLLSLGLGGLRLINLVFQVGFDPAVVVNFVFQSFPRAQTVQLDQGNPLHLPEAFQNCLLATRLQNICLRLYKISSTTCSFS